MGLIRFAYRLWLGRAACRDMRRARFYVERAEARLDAAGLVLPVMGAVVPLIRQRRSKSDHRTIDVVHARPETGGNPSIGAWTVDPQTDP